MTVRRTPQAEAILHLRDTLALVGRTLMDTDPDVLPGALQQARADVEKAWARAVKAGVGK